MINQTHIVIDLETMGIGTNAAIVAIGAVRIESGQHTAEFYRRVDLASSIAHGGTTDASTINWWLKQSPEARAEVDGSQQPADLIDVLLSLSDFIQARHEPRLWGNGATFDLRNLGEAFDLRNLGEAYDLRNLGEAYDLRILGEAYDACHLSHPWDFRLERDLRTILELHPDAKQVGEFFGIRHHALADACHEAKQLCKALMIHQQQAAIASQRDCLERQVATLQSDANSWQSGYDKGRSDGTKHRVFEIDQERRLNAQLQTRNEHLNAILEQSVTAIEDLIENSSGEAAKVWADMPQQLRAAMATGNSGSAQP